MKPRDGDSGMRIEQRIQNGWLDTFLVVQENPTMNANSLNDIHYSQENVVMVAIPMIKKLPSDPKWEAVEAKLTAHSNRKVAPFEE
jgi:hypothetical protein